MLGQHWRKRQQILELWVLNVCINSFHVWQILLVDSFNTHSDFFSLTFFGFESSKTKSLVFSDSIFTRGARETQFRPVRRTCWDPLVLPRLFSPDCCLKHRCHPRTTAAIIKDDRAEKEGSCFFDGILEAPYKP